MCEVVSCSCSLRSATADFGKPSLLNAGSPVCHLTQRDLLAGEAELQQTDTMINHMIVAYLSCLALGWGLLFFDWALNEVEKHPKAEPWISNAVTIGGASAVLSPIIQWGHAVAYSSNSVSL